MRSEGNDSQKGNGRIRKLLILLVAIVLFAYATEVTQVDLREPLEPKRQENLISLLRELARPDLLSYENETLSTNISVRMPCPEEVKASQVQNEGRTVLLIPNCATTTQDVLSLQGEGFPPNASGLVRWYPAESETTRRLAEFKADANGTFRVDFTMPDIRETADPQRIELQELTARHITGLSDTTLLALDKIVETVLMALMASTIGTILAVPISFMAARNLMTDIKLPLAAIMGSILLLPVGGWLGWWGTQQLVALAALISGNAFIGLGAAVVLTALTVVSVRVNPALSPAETKVAPVAITGLWLGTAVLSLLTLATLAQVGLAAGAWLQAHLGVFAFVGNFIFVLSDLLTLLLPALVGLVGILVGMSLGGRYGQEAVIRLPERAARLLTLGVTMGGTAVFVIGVCLSLFWVNLLGIREYVPETVGGQLQILILPALVVGGLAAAVSLLRPPKYPYPIGIATYTFTRSVLNITRSIEPLMMGFVFVVWVGLGPFAGILALTLHSVADLGKLFSEQVENIDDGPREAVNATGANAVQSVVYAVVPQVTPHYIAYIFYRWDINVRMSTIIGFVGGGGIGFVLQRYLNQLQYSRASVLVIAIAVVVTILDNVSSRIRTRIT
ncbi:MAG: ABC transporter permease subunit [Anaerolineales bacterium]|nr:ABC transporter permease subunit [Anaerolineales bacterium]